jgi:hypothetical protein
MEYASRDQRQKKQLVRWLIADEMQINNFNNYQPAVIAIFVVAWVLISIGTIYACSTLPAGDGKHVIVGTGLTGWLLFIVVAILYGVSVAPPAPAM